MFSMKLLAAAVAVALSVAFGSSVALADHDNSNPKADANCDANLTKQQLKGNSNNPNKIDAPTNCDHFYNTP